MLPICQACLRGILPRLRFLEFTPTCATCPTCSTCSTCATCPTCSTCSTCATCFTCFNLCFLFSVRFLRRLLLSVRFLFPYLRVVTCIRSFFNLRNTRNRRLRLRLCQTLLCGLRIRKNKKARQRCLNKKDRVRRARFTSLSVAALLNAFFLFTSGLALPRTVRQLRLRRLIRLIRRRRSTRLVVRLYKLRRLFILAVPCNARTPRMYILYITVRETLRK
jgi:hypothetical protein